MLANALQYLSDDDLVAAIARITGTAREATAALIAHLAEMDRRGLHLALGYQSLYAYCRGVLHLSEHESYNRMEAARIARRIPVILPMLAEGRLHLTAVSLLGPHLNDEDHLALLGGAIHKSKREVEALLARWFPKEDVASSIRKLPVAAKVSGPARAQASLAADAQDVGPVPSAWQPPGGEDPPVLVAPDLPRSPSPSSHRPVIVPLSSGRHLIKFTASDATLAKLREAQELLSHSVPSGDVGEIVDRALTALLDQAAKRKHAATGQPRPGRTLAPASRSIPAAVQREVWARDGGRCAFVSSGGRRCEERRFVEFHDAKPWAAGGMPTTENIALRCRAHNAYEADVYFGPIRTAVDARTRSGTSPGVP